MVSHESAVAIILKGFDPISVGLPKDFVLTNLTQMKGCGCKVPRNDLLNLLQKITGDSVLNQTVEGDHIGIGLDSCVIPLRRHPGISLVQTTDFFFPLGRITCANVLSDLYAMGVYECDNMLMLVGVSVTLTAEQRDTVVGLFMQGFKDCATLAETAIRGGQTVRCPWLLLGGVATRFNLIIGSKFLRSTFSVCSSAELLHIDRAEPDDVLVLTKPLGGQPIVNAYEWLKSNPERVKSLNLDEQKIKKAYHQLLEAMCRLNRNASRLLHKYNAHASTDVTGFGIAGHSDSLAKVQKSAVEFYINCFPTIAYADEISSQMENGNGFRFYDGFAAETSDCLNLMDISVG
ncbi:putative selenide, water dikinase [Ditylenchus destructor]|uniref:Selenide, water dikinase n=1 Tax=Ditylenchus destructor TaxID=166010 RepID=A0AAD4NGZ7_9BILA|nr:putative selenide, water dikinase [Ditylenchus destructor]